MHTERCKAEEKEDVDDVDEDVGEEEKEKESKKPTPAIPTHKTTTKAITLRLDLRAVRKGLAIFVYVREEVMVM